MKNIKVSALRKNFLDLLFYGVIILAFAVRVFNLSYNSPFNDEAIYVVVGRLGLFAGDWWSYGATYWMAGLPFFYPSLSALAYETGGIIGSRFLNVVFGVFVVEEVYRFTRLINLFDQKTNQIAAIVAAFVAAFSGAGIYVSRLATYDVPSFFLLMFSINSYLKAKYYANGKYYFLSAVSFLAAFATKFVVVFFAPILFVISMATLDKNPKTINIWIKYVLVPFIVGIGLYAALFLKGLIIYSSTHRGSEGGIIVYEIFDVIRENLSLVIVVSIASIPLLVRAKKGRVVQALLVLASVIPLSHLFLNRSAALNKHIYLSVIFLSPLVGYGVAQMVHYKYKAVKIITFVLLPILSVIYILNSMLIVGGLEHEWESTYQLEDFFVRNIKPENKILTEAGASVILALYDKIFPPTNVVTFDWINYSGLTDDRGYMLAVNDRYFDFIELEEDPESRSELKQNIRKDLQGGYSLVYRQGRFEVFAKNGN